MNIVISVAYIKDNELNISSDIYDEGSNYIHSLTEALKSLIELLKDLSDNNSFDEIENRYNIYFQKYIGGALIKDIECENEIISIFYKIHELSFPNKISSNGNSFRLLTNLRQ